MDDVRGRVALITGAASGIGFALAEALGMAGAKLVLADIEPEALAAAEAALRGRGWPVVSRIVDVADIAAVESAVAQSIADFGGLDIVCNNAGVGLEGPIESWTDAGWRWVLGVNVMGVVNGVRAAAPHLKAQGRGHILNTASIGGLSAAAHHGQYAASKFAVVGLSQSLRDELAPHDVGVSVLCPGFVKSRIATSARNASADLAARQAWLMREGFTGPAAELFRLIEDRVAGGLDPAVVAQMALQAIRTNAFYVLTEAEFLPELERRERALKKAIAVMSAWPTASAGRAARG